MQPNSEPTPTDIAMVQAAMTGQPQPEAPAPAQPYQAPAEPALQPEPITPQPAPTQQQTDPFATLFASEPAAPVEPVAPVAPVEAYTIPTEVAAPVAPVAPTPPTDDYQSYDDYMTEVLKDVPAVPDAPDADSIDPNDPAAIKGFFDDLVNTAVARATAESKKTSAIQEAEKKAWDATFEKFPSLKGNKDLRDMVHNIRMANFGRGIAMTPTQAAEKLLASIGASYNKGVADNQVVTTYEQVQPNGGGTGAPVSTSLDVDSTLQAVQTGGEAELARILDREIKAGRSW